MAYATLDIWYLVLILSEHLLTFAIAKLNDFNLKIINKHILGRLIRKNRGNAKLIKSVEKLINDIEKNNWQNPQDLIETIPTADCVYGGAFYFFNINIHRTLILIEFEENGDATIVWAGNHDDYELTFKNNRNVIKKWLRDNSWI